jgi:hypothetical protein
MTLLNATAWIYTRIPAINTFEGTEKSFPSGIRIKNLEYGSRNSKFSRSGGLIIIAIRIKNVYANNRSRLIGFKDLN